jgi:methionyl-tRNA synthetase
MDHKTLGNIFQEIFNEFSEMNPTNLDELEDKVSNAMNKLGSSNLGSYLMESKIEDWNTHLHQTRQDNCEKCGTKLKNKQEDKQEDKQIATWVCDVNYKRYRRYCPICKVAEYPLDRVLELRPRQRLSNSVD